MSKHTPGPWVENISADGSIEVWNADYSMFIAKRHKMNDRDEAKANARLIAAAPDLLEALVELAFRAERHGMNADDARAAIAKALGEG